MSSKNSIHARQRLLNDRVARVSLSKGLGYALHAPVHIYLQVASGCNLDCYMCSEHLRPVEARHGRWLKSLSRVVFDKIADEAFPYASRLTIGVGGEPTLSPDFVYFLERAHAEGLEVHLLTNGTRLDQPEIAETVARCVSRMNISIDGATKATYERIRVGATWARIRQNLELFNRYRLARPSGERAQLTLCMVLMRSNVEELPAYIDFAHEFHADFVHAQHVIPVTPEGSQETLIHEPERYNRVRVLAERRARRLGMRFCFPDPYSSEAAAIAPVQQSAAPVPEVQSEPIQPPPQELEPAFPLAPQPTSSADALIEGAAADALAALTSAEPIVGRDLLANHAIRCGMATLDCYVLYDGRVFPCCHPYAHRKMQVGDLNHQSFAQIWNGPHYAALRQGLVSGNVPAICRSCSLVHNPPPALEDPQTLELMPALAEHYGLAASGSGADGSDSAALRALRARLRALAVEERNLSRIERNVLNVELRKLLKRMSRWGHERVYDAVGRAREILRRAPRG